MMTLMEDSVEVRRIKEQALAGNLRPRDAVRLYRKAMGYTQDEYARVAGVAVLALMEYERGQGNKTLKTVRKIFAPLGLDVEFSIKPLL